MAAVFASNIKVLLYFIKSLAFSFLLHINQYHLMLSLLIPQGGVGYGIYTMREIHIGGGGYEFLCEPQ